MSRKGYIYTIEGLIAAMIFLFYLSFVFAPPSGTDWNRHVLQDRGEELTNALTRNGILTTAVIEDSESAVNAVIDTVDAGMRYAINTTGFPRKVIDIGVAVKSSEVTTTPHTNNTTVIGSNLPSNENGFALHHNGTVFGVNVTVTDTVNDSATDFDKASFDFNHNQEFNNSFADTVEGPFNVSDRFRCNNTAADAPTACDGDDWYTIGNINYSTATDQGMLTVYNASRPRTLAERIPPTTLNGIRIRFDYTAVSLNTQHQPFSRIRGKDSLYIDTFTPGTLNNTEHIRDTVEAYLSTGGDILVRANLSTDSFGDAHFFTDSLNYSQVTAFGLVDTDGDDATNNTFHAPSDYTGEAAHAAEYFHATGIAHTGLVNDTDDGTGNLTKHDWNISAINETNGESLQDMYRVGNTTIRGTRFHTVAANTSASEHGFDKVYFSTDTQFTNMDENASRNGDVTLTVETFTVEDTHPVNLTDADDSYHFRDLFDQKIRGDRVLVERTDYRYNVSEHDLADINREPANDPPAGVPTGSNVCTSSEDYYKNETGVTLKDDGATFEFWLTNFSVGSDPCQLTYVNFDFNNDGDYNWTGNSSYSAERLWQHGDIVTINNDRYKIELDNEELDLRRNASNTVGTVIQNVEVQGSGTATLMRNMSTSDDEYALVKTVFLRNSRDQRTLGDATAAPSETAGYQFYTSLTGDVFIPIQGRAIWWYQ